MESSKIAILGKQSKYLTCLFVVVVVFVLTKNNYFGPYRNYEDSFDTPFYKLFIEYF